MVADTLRAALSSPPAQKASRTTKKLSPSLLWGYAKQQGFGFRVEGLGKRLASCRRSRVRQRTKPTLADEF